MTPDRAWTDPHLGRGGRAAGVAVSLYGVRSARNWGCGDFGDLLEVVDWVAEDLGASFVALNPLHAIHNRRPFNTSPYLPNSSFYQNFLYLDVESMEDYAGNRRALGLRQSPEVSAEIEALRGAPFVEYERVSALKLRFLKLLFAGFLREWRRGSARAREFQAFLDREGELLERFATYCALDEHLHQRDPEVWMWTEWPGPYQDPSSEETRAFRKKHWRRVMFYQYLQWQIDIQLRRAQQRARARHLSIGLYHDLALATDRFGSDLWALPRLLRAGLPRGIAARRFLSARARTGRFRRPTRIGTAKTDTGCLPNPSVRTAATAARCASTTSCGSSGCTGFPTGSTPRTEHTFGNLSEDFLRILALESVRNQVVVVGEDLGTVEPAVRDTLARFGILSYRLFYFEKNERGEFRRYEEYPRQALVSSTTHDLPTLAGFWVGADIEARRRAGMIDEPGYRSQIESRARDKQKMLDVLSRDGIVAARAAPLRRRLPRAERRAAQCHRRIPGAHAVAASGHQPGRPHQGTGAAEPARDHMAVSQLGKEDAAQRGAVG